MPKCGKPCSVWSRVVGFYRPLRLWNKGKQSEWAERVPFSMPANAPAPKPKPQQEETNESEQ